MPWNWTLPDWPDFRYDGSVLEPIEQKFLLPSGEIVGAVLNLGCVQTNR
jgi:hypothetical protein